MTTENKAPNYQAENAEMQYKHVILSLILQKQTNKQLKYHFLDAFTLLHKLWQNTNNLIHPYFAAAPRNLNGCSEN